MTVLTISEDHNTPWPAQKSSLQALSVQLQTSNFHRSLLSLRIAYV